MKAILAVFRGEATLASAPTQEFEPEHTTTTAGTTTTSTTPGTTSGTVDPQPDADDSPTTTALPQVEADENVVGVAPDRNIVCD